MWILWLNLALTYVCYAFTHVWLKSFAYVSSFTYVSVFTHVWFSHVIQSRHLYISVTAFTYVWVTSWTYISDSVTSFTYNVRQHFIYACTLKYAEKHTLYTYIYVCVCLCMCVCVRVRTCVLVTSVCTCTCMCVCLCVYLYLRRRNPRSLQSHRSSSEICPYCSFAACGSSRAEVRWVQCWSNFSKVSSTLVNVICDFKLSLQNDCLPKFSKKISVQLYLLH